MEWTAKLSNQILELSWGVKLWVGWMALLFVVSIPFRERREATWFLVCFGATFVIGAGFIYEFESIHALTFAHLICWPPFIFAIIRNWRTSDRRTTKSGSSRFSVWLHLLILTMVISLAFDICDTIKMFAH